MTAERWVQNPGVFFAAQWNGDWSAFTDQITPSPWGASFAYTVRSDGSVDVIAYSGSAMANSVNVPIGSWFLPSPNPPAISPDSGSVWPDSYFRTAASRYTDLYLTPGVIPSVYAAHAFPTGADGRITVPFPAGRFATPPAVTATAIGSTDDQVRTVEIEALSATSVTLRAFDSKTLLVLGPSEAAVAGAVIQVIATPTS
jgi:hypothetical protein